MATETGLGCPGLSTPPQIKRRATITSGDAIMGAIVNVATAGFVALAVVNPGVAHQIVDDINIAGNIILDHFLKDDDARPSTYRPASLPRP
jgi:hypothetical protein